MGMITCLNPSVGPPEACQILNHFSSEKVTLKFTGTEGPCGIEGADDPEYLVIIMPMKITEETYYNEEDEAI